MVQKKAIKVEEEIMSEPEIAQPVDKAPAEGPVIHVLSHYDIKEVGSDVYIYENVPLGEAYANEKGVKKFEGTSGQIIYYAQTLVKKFSDNVVTDGSSE